MQPEIASSNPICAMQTVFPGDSMRAAHWLWHSRGWEGVQLLALLVTTLISYLLDENAFTSAPPASKGLHEFALQDLMRIGPLYPSAFKTVIGAAPELKSRLETAIRASQASSKAKAAARLAQTTVQAAPTIKLKTSFF
ncbi:UNVERIFIED_CONTAM: hypothetical protein FKN15_030528 [Acipenser sinensis]